MFDAVAKDCGQFSLGCDYHCKSSMRMLKGLKERPTKEYICLLMVILINVFNYGRDEIVDRFHRQRLVVANIGQVNVQT
jgi:hypothetical protein